MNLCFLTLFYGFNLICPHEYIWRNILIVVENILRIKNIIKKIMILFILSVVFFNGLNVPTYAKSTISNGIAKGFQCSPRHIAQNIQSAVLALKATQYCSGIDLPYSAAQASMRVDELRCGAEASELLDDLIGDFDGKYKNIMSGKSKQAVCLKAASLSFKF